MKVTDGFKLFSTDTFNEKQQKV